MKRIVGIDTIRFVCAFLVLLCHTGLHLPAPLAALPVVPGLWDHLFNGPAAVIIFFIISGFCIHYPNRDRSELSIIPFYARRFIRITLPALAALCLYAYLGALPMGPTYGIFWSVICELVYYVLYPLLFAIRKELRWKRIILIAYLLAYALVFLNYDALLVSTDYFAMGAQTWLVGLPTWLLGCWLAANTARFRMLFSWQLWAVRLVIYLLSVALFVFKFNAPPLLSGFPVTLNLFAIPACGWLGLEIAYYQHHPPLGLLEWAGTWSYSLYIVHLLIPIGMVAIGVPLNQWLVLAASLILSCGFYYLIEQSAHKLATSVGRWLKAKQATSPFVGVK